MNIHRRRRQQYNFARSKCEIATLQMHVQATQSLCPRNIFSCLSTAVFHMQMTKPYTTTTIMVPLLLLPACPPMSANPRTSGAAETRMSLTAAAMMPRDSGTFDITSAPTMPEADPVGELAMPEILLHKAGWTFIRMCRLTCRCFRPCRIADSGYDARQKVKIPQRKERDQQHNTMHLS